MFKKQPWNVTKPKLTWSTILFWTYENGSPKKKSLRNWNEHQKRTLGNISRNYQRKDEYTAEEYYDRAGIWRNLGRNSISVWNIFIFKRNNRSFRINLNFMGEEPRFLRISKNFIGYPFQPATPSPYAATMAKDSISPYYQQDGMINQQNRFT